MKPIRQCLLATALVACLALVSATPAAAQVVVYGYNDCAVYQARAFDSFLVAYPGIRVELYNDPSLLTDSWYLSRHPELNAFLWDHPCFRQQVLAYPGWGFAWGPVYRAPGWGWRGYPYSYRYPAWRWRGDWDHGRGWDRRHDWDRGRGWSGQPRRGWDHDRGRGGQRHGDGGRGRGRR